MRIALAIAGFLCILIVLLGLAQTQQQKPTLPNPSLIMAGLGLVAGLVYLGVVLISQSLQS